MPLAIALLIVVVALGLGGYSPWATLVLEVGASALFLWCLVDILWGTRPEERAFNVQQRKVWRKMPFLTRHPNLGTIEQSLVGFGQTRFDLGTRRRKTYECRRGDPAAGWKNHR